ncbi:arylsulfatase [Microbacterium kribbense]|uniref:Arylsulfatase n=1 Tax=Microbacterium kribbense TaxID=433645 RepID=A0ABP7GQ87_9MICO
MTDDQLPSRGYDGFRGIVRELASESTPSWAVPVQPAPDAPNVIVVMLDDLGFSDLAPYGSEIRTPGVDELAAEGYTLTNYQSTPVCSPARAAFLTGLNPHRAGFATVANYDPGFPGYVNEIADDIPTIAESFRAAGYATFLTGKWHLTKEAHMHDGADKGSWPVQRGFDRYYGCLDGFTTQFNPHRLVSDNSPLTIDDFPEDYYLTDDLTDQALGMITTLRSNDPHKPFFLYLAHQAVHAPIQAKDVDMADYRGRYEMGWEVIREGRLRRQIELGILPPDTVLGQVDTDGSAAVASWSELTDDERVAAARYMEAYAATIDNVDQNLRRLIQQLKDMGEYENTIIVVTSDNGGTSEGGLKGSQSYLSRFANAVGPAAAWTRNMERDPELIGGPQSFMVHPRGWAAVANTPFRRFKAHTFSGGVRVPLIISWPQGLPKQPGDFGLRDQFAFVTDLGMTVLQLAGVEHLRSRYGVPARDTDGIPFTPILREPHHAGVHHSQYWENNGRRGMLSGRWKLLTGHDTGDTISDDQWELYDIRADPTETQDLATFQPDLVRELADQWRSSAWNNTVFPLNDDNSLYRQRPSTEEMLAAPLTILPGVPTLERYRSSRLIAFRSFEIVVDVDRQAGDEGVLLSHGDQGGGYVLFAERDRICFSYNEYGRMHRMSAPWPGTGPMAVRLSFSAVEDVQWAFHATVDGQELFGAERLLQLVGMAPFTGISIGIDRGGPVDWDLWMRKRSFRYSGRLDRVTYLPGKKAGYDPETIINVEAEVSRIYE